jgi:hypothetical protein
LAPCACCAPRSSAQLPAAALNCQARQGGAAAAAHCAAHCAALAQGAAPGAAAVARQSFLSPSPAATTKDTFSGPPPPAVACSVKTTAGVLLASSSPGRSIV